MVERGGLENRCAFTGTEGSNPSLSAILLGATWYKLAANLAISLTVCHSSWPSRFVSMICRANVTASDLSGVQPVPVDHGHLLPDASYIPELVSPAAEASLIAQVDATPWNTELKRRVQHYGYRYDYRARAVTEDAFLGKLPGWLQELATELQSYARFEQTPDQVIINEYEPGQGISAHVDCVPCFSETIASLSLLSACTMNFEERTSGERRHVVLAPRSLLVLRGPSRYCWTHSIPARQSDMIDGRRVARGRRVSLTFRKVVFGVPDRA